MELFQKKIVQSVQNHERTVVSACHDIGKTFTAAKIILAFTSVYPGAKVITTAPTFNQVKRLLWSEIRAGFSKSKFTLSGIMDQTEWKLDPEWFALGFTSRGEKTEGEGQGGASTFQGFHAPAILVVFDEATGIPLSTWTQMEGLMTSHFVRFLGIGNPTTKSCEFFKCFSDPAYHKIKLSCFDSPNFPANRLHTKADLLKEYSRLKTLTQEQQSEALGDYKVVNTHLLTVRWVMRMVLKWGMNHPLVMSKCFGEFPDDDEHALIQLGMVQAAQFRTATYEKTDRVSIGVDVARSGPDDTVITKINGRQQTLKKVLVNCTSTAIAGELIVLIKNEESKDIHIAIDATGIGSGVLDALKQAQNEGIIPEGVEIRECHFGAGPGGYPGSEKELELKKRFLNLKARIFVELGEDLKKEVDGLCLLEEDIYAEELPTIQYKFDSKGRWQIESKEDYKRRTHRSSPDHSDSLALANFARYDGAGVGNFTKNLIQDQNSSIINYPRDTNLW